MGGGSYRWRGSPDWERKAKSGMDSPFCLSRAPDCASLIRLRFPHSRGPLESGADYAITGLVDRHLFCDDAGSLALAQGRFIVEGW